MPTYVIHTSTIKVPRHANSLKIRSSGTFSTHLALISGGVGSVTVVSSGADLRRAWGRPGLDREPGEGQTRGCRIPDVPVKRRSDRAVVAESAVKCTPKGMARGSAMTGCRWFQRVRPVESRKSRPATRAWTDSGRVEKSGVIQEAGLRSAAFTRSETTALRMSRFSVMMPLLLAPWAI